MSKVTKTQTTKPTSTTGGQPVKADVYARVTDRIILAIEQETRPWMKPWSTGNTT